MASAMPRLLKHLGAVVGLILVIVGAACQPAAALSANDSLARMHRGMNIMDGDPVWDGRAAWFRPDQFVLLRDAGFDTVRINLHTFPHIDSAGRIDAAWLATLDRYVRAALADGLTVILDAHDDNDCAKDLAACRRMLPQVWTQIASRHRDAPDALLFELMNEPHGAVTAEVWNSLMRDALRAVRATNPVRNVVIGPAGYSSVEQLPTLDLPADAHIIATVHYYWPTRFTHQGVPWLPDYRYLSGIAFGSDEETTKIVSDFGRVAEWGRAHERPIFLGEFGTYEKGDLDSRVRYLSTVARIAEAHGFAWALWEFETDFAAYDMKRDVWHLPLLKALVP
jgi:endoglucanase